MKPKYKRRSWRCGRNFGSWNVPFCGHCGKQLGLLAEQKRIGECPSCGEPVDWKEQSKEANT